MQTSLAILPRPQFDERPNALLIADADYDAWLARGKALYAKYSELKWHILDWIAYGLEHFGDEFWQAIAETGYERHTITNNMRIHRAYPTLEDRVEGCSMSAHEAAIVLPPQQRYQVLEQAAREGEGRDWVRDEVKRIKGDGSKVEPYIIEREVSTSGTLELAQLPLETWGKLVRVRIELVRVA